MIHDPIDALNRKGFENPFSQGVNSRGTADLSSRPLGLPRTDRLMFAVSSEPGPHFSSGLNLSDLETPEARTAAGADPTAARSQRRVLEMGRGSANPGL